MKSITIISFIIYFLAFSAQAQNVKLKNDILYINGNECLSYKFQYSKTEITLFELNTDKELIYMNSNGDFTKYTFTTLNKSMESRRGSSWNWILKDFVNQGVIDSNCNLNEIKVTSYIEKFDEKISNRTIIIEN